MSTTTLERKSNPDPRQQAAASRETNAAPAEAAAIVPPVDVFEDESGITLRADLPGVSKDGLNIRVDGDTLTIEGAVSLGEAPNLQAVYAEVRVAQFKRSFVLSRDLDTEKIDAKMRNGVLHLHVPKLEQARPRRIPVRAE